MTLGFLLLLKRKWFDSSSFAPQARIQAAFFAKSRADKQAMAFINPQVRNK